MPAANEPEDLGQIEDSFNSYLDKLARGESTLAGEVDSTLAETALRVHAMAARTNAEIEMLRNVWSTVLASTGGGAAAQLPGMGFSGRSRVVSWSGDRRRKRSWRFGNHAAMAAVLIVALLTGYFGFRGGLPNGGSNQPTGSMLADPASTPYAVTGTTCDVEPRTVEEVESIASTPVARPDASDLTVLPEAPDAKTIEGVQQTQQQLIACAMEPLRLYALYSDNCLRAQVFVKDPNDSKAEYKPGTIATAIAEDVALMEEKRATAVAVAGTPTGEFANEVQLAHIGGYEVIYADDVELLSDGRVGAIVRWISVGGETTLIPQNPTYRFFVDVDGRWLWDCDAPVSRG